VIDCRVMHHLSKAWDRNEKSRVARLNMRVGAHHHGQRGEREGQHGNFGCWSGIELVGVANHSEVANVAPSRRSSPIR
jgi:hypothetical protein